MKNKITLLATIIVALFIVSCEKDNSEDYNSSEKTEYYVRYSVSSTYPYVFSDVKYADVNGTGSFMNYQTRSWSVTIGPVKKGFNAFVKNENGTATDKIEVSKDGGPFATKASGNNSASYRIDF
ncbi:MAG: hypothetical protein J6T87_11325 [Bacteroidales bacterium]|nr:hypothetical protein [Bacteroidales bacterium]